MYAVIGALFALALLIIAFSFIYFEKNRIELILKKGSILNGTDKIRKMIVFDFNTSEKTINATFMDVRANKITYSGKYQLDGLDSIDLKSNEFEAKISLSEFRIFDTQKILLSIKSPEPSTSLLYTS